MSTAKEGLDNPPNSPRTVHSLSDYSGGQIALYVICQFICFCVGLCLFVCAILRCMPFDGWPFAMNVWSMMRVISIVYLICFGLYIMQCCLIFPRIEQALFGCYVTWIGRGLFFVLCGALLISNSLWDIIFGVIIMFIGVLFCLLEIPYFRYIHPPRGVIPAERWF